MEQMLAEEFGSTGRKCSGIAGKQGFSPCLCVDTRKKTKRKKLKSSQNRRAKKMLLANSAVYDSRFTGHSLLSRAAAYSQPNSAKH